MLMAIKVVLVGNPNTGKTTLFNTITHSSERVANFSGVTVAEKTKNIKVGKNEITVVDLPGLYSLNTLGKDEVVAKNFIMENQDAQYVFVATALNLQKNINLLRELCGRKLKVAIFINDFNTGKSTLDVLKLEELLKIPVLLQNARRGRKKILDWILKVSGENHILSSFDLGRVLNYCNIQVNEQKLDKVILHPLWGKVVFVIILLFVLIFSFYFIDKIIGHSVGVAWDFICQFVVDFLIKYNLKILADFFSVVIFASLGAVITFLPELFSVLFFMYLLEESGYLTRVATLFNFELNKIGLNGQSIFSMVMGVGCTTSGMIATRNICNSKTRCTTAKFLPFIGCSAKIPIALYLLNKFVYNFYIIVLLYLMVILLGIVTIKMSKVQDEEPMVIELPRLKFPSVNQLLNKSIELIKEFCIRVFTVLIIVSSIIWLFTKIQIGMSGSIIDILGNILSYLLLPLGLKDKSIAISLITGIMAKENIMSTLVVFGEPNLAEVSAISFILFVLLYSPCIPALKSAKIEFGRAFEIKMFFYQMMLAYFVTLIYYTFARIFGVYLALILAFSFTCLGILGSTMIKNNCKKICNQCPLKA